MYPDESVFIIQWVQIVLYLRS